MTDEHKENLKLFLLPKIEEYKNDHGLPDQPHRSAEELTDNIVSLYSGGTEAWNVKYPCREGLREQDADLNNVQRGYDNNTAVYRTTAGDFAYYLAALLNTYEE